MKKISLFTVFLLILLVFASSCESLSGVDFNNPLNPNETEYKASDTGTYTNNLEIEGQWGSDRFTGSGSYGIGDPFVMRFDGKYYMYPSSGAVYGAEQGIKVFESDNLVDWNYKGLAAVGKEVERAYAPEVIYYNGAFYMTEAPAGEGHYILKSDSPLGPFVPITENFGRNIDGSFWLGDDGTLYFIYPANNAVNIAKVDPSTMLPDIENSLSAGLNGWTEGPGLMRRGDAMYLTYTGNNVTSDGYRVGYSYQLGDNLEGPFVLPENNLLLLRTGPDNFRGLGHNSNVYGPDLDSFYAAYHNLISAAGPQRRMMVDQIHSNGGVLLANGPTFYSTALPKRPDFEAVLSQTQTGMKSVMIDGVSALISEKVTEAVFTAEYNFTLKSAPVSLIYSFKDEKNYTGISIDSEGKLSMLKTENGRRTTVKEENIGAVAQALHTVRIEQGADKTNIYFDAMKKLSIDSKGEKGSIGYIGDAAYSYTAFSNDAFGTSDFDSVKNIPSVFSAVHYLKTENRGFLIKNAKIKEEGIRQGEKENTVKNENDGSSSLILDTKGDWVKYALNVSEESFYGLSAMLKKQSVGAQLQVIVDSKEIYTFTVPDAGKSDGDYVNLLLGQFMLGKGNHTLKIRLMSGEITVKQLEFMPTNPAKFDYSNKMDQINEQGWTYIGNWKTTDAHTVKAGDTAIAFTGTEKLTDFSIEADIALGSEDSIYDAGILLRVKNHSIHASQVAESMQGYYLAIRNDQVTLNKYNYGGQALDLVNTALKKDEYHRFKAVLSNNRIQIFIDDMDMPKIDYYDSMAFLSGQTGIFANKAAISVKNLTIKSSD